jgi:hypothetical protein
MGSLHGFSEARGEYGPVGTIGENVGDFGRDFHSNKRVVVLVFHSSNEWQLVRPNQGP